MSTFDGSPAEMPIRSGHADWPSPGEATAERLLSGQGATPDAPSDLQALARVLSAATRPATEQELAGEQAAVAAFLAATASRRSWTLTKPKAGQRTTTQPLARKIPVIAAGAMFAVVVALGGTAAAGGLPGPLQQVAHSVFGAPAPAPVAPAPSETQGPPQPATTLSQSPAPSHPAKQKAGTPPKDKGQKKANKGDDNGKDKGNSNGDSGGNANGNSHGNDNANGNEPSSGTGNSQGSGTGNSQGSGTGQGSGPGAGSGHGAGTGTWHCRAKHHWMWHCGRRYACLLAAR